MTVALIVAAGSGERLGAGRPKAFVELAGRPMLAWSLAALSAAPSIAQIVVAAPAGGERDGAASSEQLDAIAREASDAASARVLFVQGGASRSESVQRALAAADREEVVLVHDAARPLLTAALAEAVIAALDADEAADAAIAAAPVTDTIKRAGAHGGAVRETLDRGELWSVQTPQVFRRATLERALEVDAQTLAAATDDASLIERRGGSVLVVPSPAWNFKVTTSLELRVAELLLAERGASAAPPDPA